jgi:hypothetical protein
VLGGVTGAHESTMKTKAMTRAKKTTLLPFNIISSPLFGMGVIPLWVMYTFRPTFSLIRSMRKNKNVKELDKQYGIIHM